MRKTIASLLFVIASAFPVSADGILGSKDFTLTIEDAGASAVTAPCLAAGGTVADAAGTDVCRFNANYCPAGWSQHQGWSTWSSHSQKFSPNYYPFANKCTTRDSFWNSVGVTVSAGSRAWSNVVGSPTGSNWAARPSACTLQLISITTPVTKRTQIGCLPN